MKLPHMDPCSSSAPRLTLRAFVLLTPLASLGAGSDSHQRSADALHIVEVRNGFGLLLPHRVPVPDGQGLPTPMIVEIRTFEDLANVRPLNPILPTSSWPAAAVLPSALPGNHFVVARFDQPLDVDSILTDRATAAAHASLTGAIRVERVDPTSGARRTLRGRAFVGGKTYGSPDPSDPSRLLLERWVAAKDDDTLVALDPRALGFPGTQGGFASAAALVDVASFVFVPDEDGDLSTHEPFPAGGEIQVRIGPDVRARQGGALAEVGLASATVGMDTRGPEVARERRAVPSIVPGNGQDDVDPRTDVRIRFTEPIQLLTVGPLDDGSPPSLSGSVELRFGPASAAVSVPFTVLPVSPFDLATLVLDPAHDLPGSGPVVGGCPDLAAIEVRIRGAGLADLAANHGQREVATGFHTAPGPGLVNAPVTPDTIYVARSGARAGLSVIDLNGFGASTGNPQYDSAHPIVEGNSNYPNNPNVRVQGTQLIPPLAQGTCTFDGGSAGVFTLTKDSALDDVLTGSLLASAADMALGHALDGTFNDGAPFGCQSGGGNLCASTGLKLARLAAGGPNTLAPAPQNVLPLKLVFGGENLASWAPHPNPPPLVFPPLCQSPLIQGLEPTSVTTSRPPPQGPGLSNLLVPGPNALGNPILDRPPTNILSLEQNAFFEGPGAPQPNITACPTFSMRQKIGQFLYVADRAAGEIVVLDSNRFLVLDRITLPDPTSLAMSPNLDLLAISSATTGQVFFLDVDPLSATFHEIVRATAVGAGPSGVAWESGNEDVFVCCPGSGSVYVISAFTLEVRKKLSAGLDRPMEVALTPRQLGFGFLRGVYFGYILDGVGRVAVFESGPDGINGWGFDEIIGTLPFHFARPKAIQPDIGELASGFFVVHENPLGLDGLPTGEVGGALTRVKIGGGLPGIQLLVPGEQPHVRNLDWVVAGALGASDGLSGIPVDVAFDDQRNLTALTNFSTQFSAGQPLSVNGKSLVRFVSTVIRPASAPRLLFLAVSNPGVIDVFELETLARVDVNVFHPGFQSIPALGVTGLMSYFRQ